jgi:hypothetical protein
MKISTIKVFFFVLFLASFFFNEAFAEYECKKWDLPDSNWRIRQHADSLGSSDDGVWWMIKPTGKQPQILVENIATLSSNCKTLTLRYSVTGGGQSYVRAYFGVGSNAWDKYYDYKYITLDSNAQDINFTVPSGAVGKFTKILIDLFDTDNWQNRTIYINHITIKGEEDIPCTYSLSPSSQSFNYQAGSNKLQVITNAGCQWSATESSYFINITSGSSGNGSGYVYYQVDSNTGASSRTATITVAGKSFYISQESPPECTYSVSPTNKSFNYYADTGSITVSSPNHCNWRASSNKSWLQITSGSSGSGNGTVQYKLSENTTTSNRSAIISIQNKTTTITQRYREPDPGHLVLVSDELPASIPSLGGTYYMTIKNDGESSIDVTTISPSWVTIVPNQVSLDPNDTQRLAIIIISVESDDNRSGTLYIQSSNGIIEKKIVQLGMETELTIENIKIRGDDIIKNGNVYELSGHLQLGHVRGNYVAGISSARAEIDFNAKTITIFDNQTFSIIDTDTWQFRQTTWNINCSQGNAAIKSQLGLGDAGFIEFDGVLDFKTISFSGVSHFSGVFEALGQVNFSINFQNPEVALRVQTGKSFEIWPLKLDILDSSAGFQLNLYENDFSIEINADLNVLDVGFVDGSVFFSPFSGNKLNLKWDGLENQLIFTGDTEISLPLSLVKKYVDDTTLQQLENEGRIQRSVRKKIVNIGLVIRENSFVDFDDASFHLNCSVTAQATDQFEITIDPITLALDWSNKKFLGQIGTEKDLLSFLKAKGGTAFDFNWGTSDYTLMGDFVLQLWCAHIDLNAGIQFHYQGAKYLRGWTTASMSLLNWELAPYAEFYIYSNRVVYNGHSVKFPWRLKSTENNMTLNIDFITERIDGNIIPPLNIPETELYLNANSYFSLNPEDSALNVSAVYKGIDLNWKIYPEPFSADLIKKQGITLSTASEANMRVQSNTDSDRYIEINPTGEFTTNNMADMMFSCIRTVDPITNKSWKVISIKPKDSRKSSINETFTVLLDNIQENNALQLTYIQSNDSLARTTNTTRFVVYDEDELQAGKSYSTTVGQLENVSPLVRDDGLQSIATSFYDVNSSADGLSFDNINATMDADEFVIDVVLNQPANCALLFGENESTLSEPLVSEAEVATHHQFRLTKNDIQAGWVYKVKAFVDDVVVYSGVNVVPLIKPVSTERHFPEIYGNPADETWTVYLSSATLDGIHLQENDEIAIFDNETMVGSYKISEVLTEVNQLKNYITAWTTLYNGDGFQAGQLYTFKCWDMSAQKEFTCIKPVLTNPYGDAYTGTMFPDGDGNYSIVSLNFVTRIKQTIALTPGYQFISLNVMPEHTEMIQVFENILEHIDFAKDSNGNLLRKMGPNWVNNIGSWKITDGYLIRMNEPCSLDIEGIPVDTGISIPLKTGYQFVAYLLTEPEDTLLSFADILENIDFGKDSDGNLLRKIGTDWVNNIGNLNPGEGYLLKMNADDDLLYNKEILSRKKMNVLKETEKSSHFGDISGNPADATWTIYLTQAQINETHLEASDEIAIFDGNKLVGAFQLTEALTEENQNNHYLTAWATLNDGDGYTPGNIYTFKCWDASAGIEYSTYELTLMNPYNDGYTETVFPSEDGIYSIAKFVFTEKQHKTGDMNDDGIIDLKDALWILKMLVGME